MAKQLQCVNYVTIGWCVRDPRRHFWVFTFSPTRASAIVKARQYMNPSEQRKEGQLLSWQELYRSGFRVVRAEIRECVV